MIPLGECLAEETLECFPVKDGRGSPILRGPGEDWPLGQNHRWQGRKDGPSSPHQWPQPLIAACPWHVTAGSGGPVRQLGTLPP